MAKAAKRRRSNPIPTAPTGPPPGAAPTAPSGGTYTGGGGSKPTGGGTKSSGGSSGGGRSGGSSGGGGMSDYDKSVRRANAERRKAGQTRLANIRSLESQAKALQKAIQHEYGRNLRQNLSDIKDVLQDQQALVMDGYGERYGMLKGASRDNEKSQAGQSMNNIQNSVRERTSAMSEAMSQGAGESDVLNAQMMGLRNWHANQGEITRGYFDTLRSINSGLTDLNVDTKTAMANNEIQANADREQLWTNYYNQRSESLIQLGNIRGQQATEYAAAKEYGVGASAFGKSKGGGKGKGGDKKNDGGGRKKKNDGGKQDKNNNIQRPAAMQREKAGRP